ncbi:dienelactone hydrolase family protein [Longispora albida]|uniref:dienelactone hydrolase family protein n=1 Tax=Longispora albida TaxID=203523 RepID=UPI000475A985|nr:alpha/beta hydrolase [Longispora albida]
MLSGTLVRIAAAGVTLEADLDVPEDASGVVLFAHDSGSSRLSPRDRMVAGRLRAAGLGTVLADLLTPAEVTRDALTARWRFDIGMMAGRVAGIVDLLGEYPATAGLPLGLSGASTGAAAALVAAAQRPEAVRAVVSRSGRTDLAGSLLAEVTAPVLLIVGGHDEVVIELNQQAAGILPGVVGLHIVPGATHLFAEPDALEEAADQTVEWFTRHLSPEAS